jgi:hypothetical protein
LTDVVNENNDAFLYELEPGVTSFFWPRSRPVITVNTTVTPGPTIDSIGGNSMDEKMVLFFFLSFVASADEHWQNIFKETFLFVSYLNKKSSFFFHI